MKKIFQFTALIFFALLAFGLGKTVHAYQLTEPEKFDFKDIQIEFSADDGEDTFSSGACYGPLFSIDSGTKDVGEIGRICGLGAMDLEGHANVRPGVGIMIFDLMGAGFTVGYLPDNKRVMAGFSISFMDLWKRSVVTLE